MTQLPTPSEFAAIRRGYSPDSGQSLSLHADAYTRAEWYAADQQLILAKSWQWVCHVEKLRSPGTYVTTEIAGRPIAVGARPRGRAAGLLQRVQAPGA